MVEEDDADDNVCGWTTIEGRLFEWDRPGWLLVLIIDEGEDDVEVEERRTMAGGFPDPDIFFF